MSDARAYVYEVALSGAIEVTVNLDAITDPHARAAIIWQELMLQYPRPEEMIDRVTLTDARPLDP